MNIINKIRAYLLVLKASRYQGRGKLEKVIEICSKARQLDPKSQAALLLLGDDYVRLKRYEEARKVLQEALKFYPNDMQFNIMYAEVLAEKGARLEEVFPYAKRYLDNKPKGEGKWPIYMKGLSSVSGKKNRLVACQKDIKNYLSARDEWAEKILKLYEESKRAT